MTSLCFFHPARLAALAGLIGFAPGIGAQTEIRVTGTVTDAPLALAPTIQVGDFFTLDYSLDAGTPDSDASPTRGEHRTAVLSACLSVGAYSATARAGEVWITNTSWDAYYLTAPVVQGAPVHGMPVQDLFLLFTAVTGNALSSDALPVTPPDLAKFRSTHVASLAFSAGSVQVDITTSSVGVSPAAMTHLRDPAPNVVAYNCSAATLGSTWYATVDVGTTGFTHALVLGYASFDHLPQANGQILLIAPPQVFRLQFTQGPIVSWFGVDPNDPSLAGTVVHTQAGLLLGAPGFALTNGQDLSLGH